MGAQSDIISIGWSKDTLTTLRMFEAAVTGELTAAFTAGTKKAVQYVLGEVIRRIKAGRYERLGMLTQALRNAEGYGNTPLLKTGALVRAITSEVLGELEGEIGVNKFAKGSRSRDPSTGKFQSSTLANVAVTLHEGATIRVTDAMRRAFARKMAALSDKFSLLRTENSRGSGVIRIPPRPFIRDVFEDAAVVAKIQDIMTEELRRRVQVLR